MIDNFSKFTQKQINESKSDKDIWWDKNHKKLIDLEIPYEDIKVLIPRKDFEGVYNSSSRQRALYFFNTRSIEYLNDLISDYTFEDE